MENTPPKWITDFLRLFIRKDILEAIEGDLYELYNEDFETNGGFTAGRRFLINTLMFLRYHRIRKRKNSKTQNHMDLFKNYLKISFRDLGRHSVFSLINLSSLIVGFISLLLILQYVLFETSYDTFHKDSDRIYRIINDRYQNGVRVQHGAITYPTIGPTLKNEYSEVENYTRLTVGGRNYLTYEENLFMFQDYVWADENFLDFFDFKLISGDKNALSEPASVVLTESYARRLLNGKEESSILHGKVIQLNDWDFPCKITGIIKDTPDNSHLRFDLLISYKTFIRLAGDGADNSWEWSDFYHYVKLAPGADPEKFEKKLNQFSQKYFKSGEVSGAEEKFFLQSLKKVHLDDSMEYEYAEVINGETIRLLLIISWVIIAIAWINYINLTTSRAVQRAKEVGLRKVLGAYRRQLIGQFLTESILMNLIALIISVFAVWLITPFFNEFLSLPLGLHVFIKSQIWNIPFLIVFLAAFVILVLIVGSYPAFLLSGFRIEEVIKGKFKYGDYLGFRRALVVFQYTTAIILIAGSISIYRQVSYMQNRELGMNLENNLVVYGPDMRDFDSAYIDNFEKFKSQLTSHSGIMSATSSSRIFGSKMARVFRVKSPADPDQNDLSSNWMAVDHDFMDQFSIKLIEGRNFDYSDHSFNPGEINTLLLNKAAVDAFRFRNPKDAIGKVLVLGDINRKYRIIGVVENFHQLSLRKQIEPIILFPFYDNSHFITVKYAKDHEERAINITREVFREFYPGNYFDYFFLKDHFNSQYSDDQMLGKISTFFTFLAVVIAMSGLYGLVMITFMRKTKEIGIRKVLGAGVVGLIRHFGRHFLKLTTISIVLGLPLSYWLISKFLEDYAYSTGVEIWVLILAAFSLITMCLVTILLQIGKVSRNNPVESLRYE